jgi:CBS domain-containing protein
MKGQAVCRLRAARPGEEINMRRAEELFHGLATGDVMRRATLVLPHGMSVVAAARLLLERQVRVAPVTDILGRCVGVLSKADALRWAMNEDRADEESGAPAACVWCDWQVVDLQTTQRDEVSRHMTTDPMLVTPDTRLAAIAGILLAHHRPIVVVDEKDRPLGVVSSNGVLAGLAFAGRRPEEMPAVDATDRRFSLRRSVQPSGRA